MRLIQALLLSAGLLTPLIAGAELRMYEVDARYRAEVQSALQTVLGAYGNNNGVVQILPTGQLLVEAPPDRQAEIGQVIEAIAASNPAPTPQIALRYWVVLGMHGAIDANEISLQSLGRVLDRIESIYGEMGFVLLDTTNVINLSGEVSSVDDGELRVSQHIVAGGDTAINARINVEYHTRLSAVTSTAEPLEPRADIPVGFDVSASVSIEPDQYLVIGENTVRLAETTGVMFIIVHWPGLQ